MTGAARLAARGARRIGAGLVTIAASPEAFPIYAADMPGTLVKPLAGRGGFGEFIADPRRNAVLVGRAPASTKSPIAGRWRRWPPARRRCWTPTR